jgi:NAD(P)H-hydrate epimerase
MRYALTASQMRAAEESAVSRGSATIGALMEAAGTALASEVSRRWPSGSVVVVCGPGNNGGDGWVAARVLAAQGRGVRVLALRAPGDLTGEAAAAAAEAIHAGVDWSLVVAAGDHLAEACAGASVAVDAIFGFGFSGPARGPYADAIAALAAAGIPVASADVPSGVDSDTGAVHDAAVHAAVTVTFTALKPGLLIYPGAAYAGDVVVADLGIPDELLVCAGALELPGGPDLRPLLPVPAPTDHKGSRGRVAIVAGSLAYPGAAVLAAQGALRMGAGYVYLVVPERIGDIVRTALPNAIVRAVPSAADGSIEGADDVLAAVADAEAIVVGPGLGTGEGATLAIRALVSAAAQPVVLDADGLNVFSGDPQPLLERVWPLVLTPHPGEMARLLSTGIESVQADRIAAAGSLSGPHRAWLLKGPRSVVAGEGRRALVLAGNAGLARAGSGDVLSGMIGTLLAQGCGPYEAAILAAHLHGRAAELGTEALTETCFTSADIVVFLPAAVRVLLGG